MNIIAMHMSIINGARRIQPLGQYEFHHMARAPISWMTLAMNDQRRHATLT
jgi:hypothetical protein